MWKRLCLAGAVALIISGAWIGVETSGPNGQAMAAPAKTSFADDVMPIFRGYCVECHHPGGLGTNKSGLDLTSYASVMRGTKNGPMVIPGKPDESNLIILIDHNASPELNMPMGRKRLLSALRDVIYSWIFEGAPNN
ncbi:c-type cytochrome domain-containing protein [Rhodoblastus sp.]|uniref:c-type cytochrome domain-containing protein n=1 Tax=Rhodoblastus sp. TaxID=1962975 RepID=UPI003F945341